MRRPRRLEKLVGMCPGYFKIGRRRVQGVQLLHVERRRVLFRQQRQGAYGFTPFFAITSAMSPWMCVAAAMSAFPPAVSPFIRLATPRP